LGQPIHCSVESRLILGIDTTPELILQCDAQKSFANAKQGALQILFFYLGITRKRNLALFASFYNKMKVN